MLIDDFVNPKGWKYYRKYLNKSYMNHKVVK